ncbi:hypothetical protein C0993_005977, partial [Termitomyces sp. T159_Od127]
MAAMEVLVNTDFTTVEEACNILLRCESKLADIVAHWKGQWHGLNTPKAAATVPVASSTAVGAHSALPPALKDLDAMDVNRAQKGTVKKCFKCSKTGHFIADCP